MSKSLAERFFEKTQPEPNSGCLLWLAGLHPGGYGWFAISSTQQEKAHRMAWKLAHGDPGDMCVLHKCDTRACVNVDHLFLGTRTDNYADMVAKGRQAKGAARNIPCGERSGMAKLTEEQVREMRRRYAAGGVTCRELAGEYGVCDSLVSGITSGKRWKSCL